NRSPRRGWSSSHHSGERGGGPRCARHKRGLGSSSGPVAADSGNSEIPRRENRRGDRTRILAPLKVAGTILVPGDKSISHRSLILSSLADGESVVHGILDSEDVRSTAAVLRALGATIPELADTMRVNGLGLRGLRPPRQALDCGNSGTTTRLSAGGVAAQ